MKRFTRILTATCAAVALTSSLALAAEPVAKDAPKPAPVPAGPHAGHGQGGQGAHQMGMGMGHGALSSLTPEKQELARTLMAAHSKAMAPLHQSLYAKNAALEALNAAGEGDSAKAKAVIREIADLNARMLTENAKFRAQMVKQTGLRTPVMGHGGMMGGKGGMMGGKGGQMGGMSCPMMQNMQHGAAPAPGAPAGAPATTPAAPAADAHADHGK